MGIFQIFMEPLFWIVMGLLYALIAYSATLWVTDLKLHMTWWKWLLTAFWFAGLSVTIAGGFTLIGENEMLPGIYFLGFFLVFHIIFGAILWRIISNVKEKPLEQREEK
jgi:hypothetical protein